MKTNGELFAEFMGFRRQEPGEYNLVSWWKPDPKDARKKGTFMGYTDQLEEKYSTSWDWLMPVVEKIESVGFSFFIHNQGSYIRKTYYRGNVPDFGSVEETKISAAYQCALEFIRWYNENQPPID